MKGGSPLREREGESHQIWAERRREGGRRICTGEWEEGRMGEWEAAAWAWERERAREDEWGRLPVGWMSEEVVEPKVEVYIWRAIGPRLVLLGIGLFRRWAL
jgi:hypothetical protein